MSQPGTGADAERDDVRPEAEGPDDASDGAVGPAPPRGRRWIVLVSLLAIVAVGVCSGIWVVAGSSVVFEGSVIYGNFEQVGTSDIAEGEAYLEMVDPIPGTTRYDLVLVNTGRFSVRVHAKPDNPATKVGFAPQIGRAYQSQPFGTTEIEIGPQEQVYLQLQLTWPCSQMAAGSSIGIDAVPLEFTVLGVTRTGEIELQQLIQLRTTTDLMPGPEWGCSEAE